jgi:CRISPR-associated endoribonuclease Cas6
MRVELILRLKPRTKIPIDYQYLLSGLIYNLLKESSLEYAEFMHETGYEVEGKHLKPFTFSWFQVPRRNFQIQDNQLEIRSSQVSWYISSPDETFLQHLVTGLFQRANLNIDGQIFITDTVRTCQTPEFTEKMMFTCLSPIVVSTKTEKFGKLQKHFYRADELDFGEGIRKNLINKYKALYGVEPLNTHLKFQFNSDFLQRKGEQAYKLVHIKDTQIKAVMAPFTVEGSIELIQLGYEAGFGERGSQGFGMVEVDSRN